MNYKLKSYRMDGDRLILTITQSELFGLIKDDIECTDSTQLYSYNGQCVWYKLPKIKKVKVKNDLVQFKLKVTTKSKRIDGGTDLLDFCIQCKNEINSKNKLTQ